MTTPSRWITLQSVSFPIDGITHMNLVECKTNKASVEAALDASADDIKVYDLSVFMDENGELTFQFRGKHAKQEAEAARDMVLEKIAIWEHYVAGRVADRPKSRRESL